MSGYSVTTRECAGEEFTLYISYMFKHVPSNMVYSVFRNMGLGMLKRGNDAILFREYKDGGKSAKINFKFLFTRGRDAGKNIEIIEHLRSGGQDAHMKVIYQDARTQEEVARRRGCAIEDAEKEPERFWKVTLWRERTHTLERPKPHTGCPVIALSGGKLGKDKKMMRHKINGITPSAADRGTKSCHVLPPLDLSGIDEPTPTEYTASSPPYNPTSSDCGGNSSDNAAFSPNTPDYSPPKLVVAESLPDALPPLSVSTPKKSVSFSNNDKVYDIPARGNSSPARSDADHMNDDDEEVPNNTLNTRDELSNAIDVYRQGKFPWAGNCPSTIVGFRKWRKSKCISTPSREGVYHLHHSDDEQDANDVLQMELDWWVEQRYIRDPRKFQEKNPRRCGTKPFWRYDAYKSATTLNDALQMGALANDLRKDVERGWVQ